MIICKMYIDTYNNEECLVIEVDKEYKEIECIKTTQIAVSKEVLSTIKEIGRNDFSKADMMTGNILSISQCDGNLYIAKKDKSKIIFPIDKIIWESDNSPFNFAIRNNEYLKNTPLRKFMFSKHDLDNNFIDFIISFINNTDNYTMSVRSGNEFRGYYLGWSTYKVNGAIASCDSSSIGYVLEVIKDHIRYSSKYVRNADNIVEVKIRDEKTDKDDFSLKNMIDKDIMKIILEAKNPKKKKENERLIVNFTDDQHNSVTCYLDYKSIIKIRYSWMSSCTYGEPGLIDYYEYIDYSIDNVYDTEVDLKDDLARSFKERKLID